MMDEPQPKRSFARALALRLVLVLLGLVLGLGVAELVLAILGKPRFYEAHTASTRFAFFQSPDRTDWFYVNTPSTNIRFVYDGNPRGYFGPDNEVNHQTNSKGFRGPEISPIKPPGTIRIACLGDSFTFGEGVRFEDTYPEQLASLLAAEPACAGLTFESCNFGVGGYNTTQSLFALRAWALPAQPDIVVLGYVLNDAEPRLYDRDKLTGRFVRRPREAGIPEGQGDPRPPDTLLYKLRTARLIWQVGRNRQRTGNMIDYYRSLYDEANPGWQESRDALERIIKTCHDHGIPCVVLCFPILVDLTDTHPFADLYARVGSVVESAGGIYVNLLPKLKGLDASDLWVHPTDQHPNEVVHRIAAEAITEALRSAGVLAKLCPRESTAGTP
jgi:hypothetical protein